MSNSEVDQTTVGNYFVSNYPPYSFWTEDCKQEALDAFDRPYKEDTPLGIYIHVPFCRKRCHFCYFRVYTDKEAKEIRAYVDNVVEELRTYAKKTFVGGRKPQFLYVGGGTPSYLSPSLERMEIGRLINLDKERSIDVIITRLRKKIELDPKNPKFLQTIRGAGYVLWIE